MTHRNEVDIRADSLEPPSWIDTLESWIHTALAALDAANWQLSVLLTDDETIRRLNREYRGLDEPTDVLTFNASDGHSPAEMPPPAAGAPAAVGDIVLSLPTLLRQAEAYGVAEEEEIRRSVLHGLLHLSGHRHATSDFEHEPMLQLQERLLARLEGRLF